MVRGAFGAFGALKDIVAGCFLGCLYHHDCKGKCYGNVRYMIIAMRRVE